MKKKLTALGIMNGTSLDGIDYALIEVSSDLKKMTFKSHQQKKISETLKTRLLHAAQDNASTYEVSQLHFDLGRLYASHLKSLKRKWSWDIIGLHGQTIHHQGKQASLQIGQPSFSSLQGPCPIYYDFRSADVAVGGEGAPFAPFFQNHIHTTGDKSYAFHNLGGISNLAFFYKKKVQAFDTGPANILLDAWIKHHKKGDYDKNGQLAAKGLPNPHLVNHFLDDDFFKQKFPKSTGREKFNLNFIIKKGGVQFKRLNFNDQLATLTDVTALSIAQCYEKLKPSPAVIYFYGGGIFNQYLMKRLQFYMPQQNILTTDELGWPSQAFEASTFAFLAAARHFSKKVHLPQVTGAKKQVSLGSLYF